jgi:hypothetical protein
MHTGDSLCIVTYLDVCVAALGLCVEDVWEECDEAQLLGSCIVSAPASALDLKDVLAVQLQGLHTVDTSLGQKCSVQNEHKLYPQLRCMDYIQIVPSCYQLLHIVTDSKLIQIVQLFCAQ